MSALESKRPEGLPPSLGFVARPENFSEIRNRISTDEPWDPTGKKTSVGAAHGFEDVLGEPLGTGFWTNTPGTVRQLAFAIAFSKNPVIQEILKNESLPPAEVVKTLREHQVLAGFKIMDLGCGKPNFALAAHALGATMYTADVEDIDSRDKKYIERHVVININQPNATQILYESTGGNFDLISENVIGGTPTTPTSVSRPKVERIVEIADVLLKEGGCLDYGMGVAGYRDKVLQKKRAL